MGETSRSIEVRIKEHKYSLTQGLLQHVYEEGHKICFKEAKVLQIEPNTTHRKYTRNPPTCLSGRSSDLSTQLGHLSHLDSRYRS
jgi:hypothetical protein